jgi:hypothetical protein
MMNVKRVFKLVLASVMLTLSMGFLEQASAQDTFEEWKKQQMQEFQDFKDKRDKAFMKFLEKAWKAIDSEKGVDLYEEPKPDDMPAADPGKAPPPPPKGPKVKVKVPDAEPIPEEEIDLSVDISLDPIEVPKSANWPKVNFDYYQIPIATKYDPRFDTTLTGKMNKDAIAAYWKHVSQLDYEPLIKRTGQLKDTLALNDWAFVQMVYQMGEDVYGVNRPEATLFTWFVLTKNDYKLKVGYNDSGVYLLLPSTQRVYNNPYFTLDGSKYYVLPLKAGMDQPTNLYTYEGSYPGQQHALDFSIKQVPKFARSKATKNLSFEYNDETYDVPVSYDKNWVEFLKFFPQTDLVVYFDADVSSEAKTSLLKNLEPVIEGKSETEAVNMLLRFVQTAFAYQVDDKQFGKEKYLFPDETLHYPKSDCEDRCILFAYLVRNLTDLEVVGLRYPGHLATAVKFTEAPQGDFVKVDGKTYTIADPTYKYADIGMTMPQFKDKAPEIERF